MFDSMVKWLLVIHPEVRDWLHKVRKENRPLVDRIKGSGLHNLKELRPASAGVTEVRILFVFDPPGRSSCWWPETSLATGSAGTTRRYNWPRHDTRSISRR